MNSMFEGGMTNLAYEYQDLAEKERKIMDEYADHCFRLVNGSEPVQRTLDEISFDGWYHTDDGLLQVEVKVEPHESYMDLAPALGLDIFSGNYSYISINTSMHTGNDFDPLEIDWDSGVVNDTYEFSERNALLRTIQLNDRIPEDVELPQREANHRQYADRVSDEKERRAIIEANEGFMPTLSPEIRTQVTELREVFARVMSTVEPQEDGVQRLEIKLPYNPNDDQTDFSTTSITLAQVMPSTADVHELGRFAQPRVTINTEKITPIINGDEAPNMVRKLHILQVEPDGYPILWDFSEVYEMEVRSRGGRHDLAWVEIPTEEQKRWQEEVASDDRKVALQALSRLTFGSPETGKESKGTVADIIEAEELIKKHFVEGNGDE